MKDSLYLKIPQVKAELEKCLQCATKPCMHACPACVSPKDFIAEAKSGNWKAAARLIYEQNPMGEICGLICPDRFCMKACVRSKIDAPIRIPPLQAVIMQKARVEKVLFEEKKAEHNGKKVAIIGAGPAGLGAVSVLLKNGYAVTLFEKSGIVGGALNLIPDERLPQQIIAYEWQRFMQNSLLEIRFNHEVEDYQALLDDGFVGVIIATGEQKTRKLGIEGENLALTYIQYLAQPQKYVTNGVVAVIGGGAVAVDCAITAKKQGAKQVEMFVRRRLDHMRITEAERLSLLENGIDITTMTRSVKIEKQGKNLTLWTTKTKFNDEEKLEDIPNTVIARPEFKYVILALGSTRAENMLENQRIIYAGDVMIGGSTAVEAVADGKRAAQKLVDILRD